MSEEERSMIAIVSADHKNIIGCHSIKTSTILAPGKGPKYVLNGIDRFSIFGEHSVLLGVYAETEDIEKEIRAIREAVERGNRTYELQFCMEEPFGEERNEPE
ncbi:MAG: hypothetical protein IJM25_00405 [Eubacterium sp.]|nr:hypothetical protein [Eubacterium sp.]